MRRFALRWACCCMASKILRWLLIFQWCILCNLLAVFPPWKIGTPDGELQGPCPYAWLSPPRLAFLPISHRSRGRFGQESPTPHAAFRRCGGETSLWGGGLKGGDGGKLWEDAGHYPNFPCPPPMCPQRHTLPPHRHHTLILDFGPF